MKVVGCSAVAVVKLTMVVDRIVPEEGAVTLYEKREAGEFWIVVPTHRAKQINVGDTLVVLCVPSASLGFAEDTMVVAKRDGDTTRVIHTRGLCWDSLWRSTLG